MTERIRVKDFLTIEDARIDLRPICILIGPQASGKSVLAKLLFFCRQGVKSTLRSCVAHGNSYDEFKCALIRVFCSYFKNDYWDKKPFQIDYRFGSYNISLCTTKANLDITLSQDIEERFTRTQGEFREAVQRNSKTDPKQKVSIPRLFSDFWGEFLFKDPFEEPLKRQIFIPSSRAFFVLFQKRMFSFLIGEGGPTDIDPFLRDFGPKYESIKDVFSLFPYKGKQRQRFYEKVGKLRRTILRGDYVRERDNEYIHDKAPGRTGGTCLMIRWPD